MASVELLQRDERALAEAAALLATTPAAVVEGVRRKLDEIKALQDELRALRAQAASRPSGRAGRRRRTAGIVVARVDDLPPGDLRDLAIAVRSQPGVERRGARRPQRHRRRVAGRCSHAAAADGQAADLLREAAQGRQGRWRRQG